MKNVGTIAATNTQAWISDFGNFTTVYFDSLAVGEERTLGPFALPLPIELTKGEYFFKACAYAAYYDPPDLNPADNCLEAPLQVDSPNVVDLKTDAVMFDAAGIYPRVAFPISTTITNNGNTEATNATVTFYLSRDAVISSADGPVAYAFTQALGPGQTRTLTTTDARTPFGSNDPPGMYYLGACVVLTSSRQAESNPTDNCASLPVELFSSLLTSDLRLANVGLLPAPQLYPGDSFSMLVDIANDGPGPAENFLVSSTWRKADTLVDTAIDSTRFADVIAAGTLTTFPITIQIPTDTAPASYGVTVCLDSANEVIEPNEVNNCRQAGAYVVVDGRRDFETISIVPDHEEYVPGQDVVLTFTVRNNGYRYLDGTYGHAFWSPDQAITDQDPEMGRAAFGHLLPSESQDRWTQNVGFKVPINSGTGTRFVGFCVDWLNLIDETNEDNNCLTTAVTVIAPASRSFPDLQPLATDVLEAAPGGTVRLAFGIRNPGAALTDPFDITIDLANTPFTQCGAGALATFKSVPGIAPGETRFFDSISVQVPVTALAPSNQYLVVCAIGKIQETSETSVDRSLYQLFVTTAPIAYNLRPGLPGTIPNAPPGGSFSVRFSVINDGGGPVFQTVRHSIRWSTDAILSSDDVEMGAAESTFIGWSAGLFNGIVSGTVPSNALPGTYYVLVCVDSTNFLLETDENNCQALPITVSDSASFIDLRISDIQLPQGPRLPGEFVTLNFTAHNDGTLSTLNSSYLSAIPFEHSIRLSTDPTIDATDPEIGLVAVGRMDAGESRSYAISLEVPSSVPSGTYYIGVCADFDFSQVLELDEANNCASAPLSVVTASTLDFRIADMALDRATALPGDFVWVTFKTINDGNAGAPSFVNAIRWSTDAAASTDDLAIRRVASGGANAASSAVGGPFKIQIPGTAGPGIHYILVCADSSNQDVETDEGNNCSAISFEVERDGRQTISLSMGDSSASSTSTAAEAAALEVGFARTEGQTGTTPYGIAIFKGRENGVIATEVAVASSAPARAVVLFVDMRKIPVGSGFIATRTGLGLANTGAIPAQLTFVMRDFNGNTLTSGVSTLAGGGHISRFVDELHTVAPGFALPPDFASATGYGTLEISSDQPIFVMSVRMVKNQRGEDLFALTSIADRSAAASSSTVYSPVFSDGGGYTSSLVLVNTSNATQSGVIRFWNADGSAAVIDASSGTGSAFNYSIRPGGVSILESHGQATFTKQATPEIAPDSGSTTPMGLAIVHVVQNGTVISEYAAPTSVPKSNVTMYADLTHGHDASVVILNPNNSTVLLNTRLWTLDNQQLDFRQRSLPPLGRITLSVDDIFPGVPAGFKGLLGVEAVSGLLNVVALRTLLNERGELLTTTMPMAETYQPAPTPVFPQIVEGGGYTTEIILINPDGHHNSAAIIGLYADDGRAFQTSPSQ